MQKTGKSKNKRTPAAKKRLRIGLGIMLTLLLVVGGKLFLVQGLDVGGMAEAAYNNRLKSTILPAERGKILDANGTVLASSVIRYNIVVDQTVNTASNEFSRYDTKTQGVDKISRNQGIAELASALGMDVNQVMQAVTGEKKIQHRGQGSEARG